ncbi:MAG: acetylxylan esterase [Opitutaceae bacterium]|jgi:cephalosporin-C deacetylase-like acetyl esterase
MNALNRALCLLVLPFSFLACAQAASSWDGKKAVDYILTAGADRPDGVYKQGETVTFKIDLQFQKKPAGSQQIEWLLSKDGGPLLQKGTAILKEGCATVTGSLNEPGFLQCKFTFKDGKEIYSTLAGAAIDPFAIKPSMPCPDDFDEFWAAQKKRLAAVPINPRLTPVPAPADRPGIEVFDLQADCIGAPVSGYYSRPLKTTPKGHPARLYVDGAGVRSGDLLASARWAGRGVISLSINAHGIPNGQPGTFYADLANGALKNYRVDGRESRDTYYFLGMYLRVLRALDFLASQPEWDGRTLIIEGGSQGGAQSIAGAALDHRVTFITAMNAAMCDHTGMVANRIAGWPKVVPVKDGIPDPAVLQAMRYFDSVNFASRVKAQVYMWEGFIDFTCPPTGVYAAYNQMTSPKEMIPAPDSTHSLDGMKLWPAVSAAEQKHIDEQAKKFAATR